MIFNQSINILLKRYRHFVETNRKKWPFFKVVVIWRLEWTLINFLNEWNKYDIIDYLKRIHLY